MIGCISKMASEQESYYRSPTATSIDEFDFLQTCFRLKLLLVTYNSFHLLWSHFTDATYHWWKRHQSLLQATASHRNEEEDNFLLCWLRRIIFMNLSFIQTTAQLFEISTFFAVLLRVWCKISIWDAFVSVALNNFLEFHFWEKNAHFFTVKATLAHYVLIWELCLQHHLFWALVSSCWG